MADSDFERKRTPFVEALATWLVGPIEHIGSTAIPGLAAKPVIDIMAGVQTLEASRPAIAAATALGYCYLPYQAELEHWFCRPSLAFRTHHLHLIPVGTPQWLRPIAFRDYLRTHADVASEYEALKRQLAASIVSIARRTRRRRGHSSTGSRIWRWKSICFGPSPVT